MKHKTKLNFCLLLLTLFIVQVGCKKDLSSTDLEKIDGEYLFVEMWIFSSARQISGNCVNINPATGEDYYYNSDTQEFEYTRKPEFPITDELKMLFGQKHQFNPIAGLGGVVVELVPVYYLSDLLTRNVFVEGIKTNNAVHLSVNFKSFDRGFVLEEDSTLVHVIKIIEEGPGDSCIWEYTDSLIIRNFGMNPKAKITYQPTP